MLRYLLPGLLAAGLLPGQAVPRPEYPQPQFERSQWLSLNGPWEFEFDDANAGLDANWPAGNHKFTRSITVPFAFETVRSGIHDTGFHPWVWYRRTFRVPGAWSKPARVLLNFGAVDYRARVWVNGRMAGGHEGGNTPFRFDITPLLTTGENVIVVRAEDPPTDRSIPRGKQYWEPESRGIFYTRTSGIWQPVWIEAAGDSYLERAHITAGMDGKATFDVRAAHCESDCELRVEVSRNGRTAAETRVPVTNSRSLAALVVDNPVRWLPSAPELYDVRYELLRDGKPVDRVASYAGFRTIRVEQGRVTINGHYTYLKFVLDQGYWPESTLTPPSDEAIQYDIRMTKAMGFNGVRKHQKLEDPRFLYWADKLGLLVSSEMANAYLFDEDYAVRFTREWMEAVERDSSHPSIIIWNPINECWGTPNLHDIRQQNHLISLVTLTKTLDPTRLVIDNEGWGHTEFTDLFAVHDYSPVGAKLTAAWGKFDQDHKFPRHSPPELAPGRKYNGTPLYLSEFGGIAFIPAGANVPKTAWGYSGVEKTADEALARLGGLYEAIANLPFAGICYTQLTDVEQEVNGLMTYDRRLKFDVEKVKQLNDLLR